MANIFEKPIITPFRTFWQSDKLPSDAASVKYKSFNPSFNSRLSDEDFYIRTVRHYQQEIGYLQPFQQSDIARDMFYSNDGTTARWTARLLDQYGNVVNGKTVTVSNNGGPYTGMYNYSVQFSLWDLPEGVYFLQYRYAHGGGSTYSYFLNEPFELRQVYEKTVRIDYKNSYNDQDIIYYSDSWEFQLRLHGVLTPLATDAQYSVYEDQPLNTTMVSGIPFRTHDLVLYDLPEWMADKVNRIMLHNTTKIEGKKWTREAAAKLERKQSETNPIVYHVLKLREAENTISAIHNANCITMCNMPQTKYFWCERIMIEGTYITVRQGFEGKRNFLDYLNTNQKVGSGYWAEDENKKLVFYANDDFTISAAWVIDAVDLLLYGMRLRLRGAGDIEMDVLASSGTQYYAAKWNGGVATVNKTALSATPTVTSIAESWSDSYDRYAYLYFSNYESIADVATNINVLSIECDIPPACTYFNPFMNATGCARFESNPFNFVTALELFDVQNMNFDTWAVDDLLRWIYDNLLRFDTSANVYLQAQQVPAIPSKNDRGINTIIAAIANRVSTLTTD